MTEIEKNGCNCDGEHEHDCECGDDCDSNIITLDMEDGTTKDYHILNILEYEGKQYVALSELDSDEYDILRYEMLEDDEEQVALSIIEDDAEYNAVANKFDELFSSELEDMELLNTDKTDK